MEEHQVEGMNTILCQLAALQNDILLTGKGDDTANAISTGILAMQCVLPYFNARRMYFIE